jgi:hypothetical protein
MIITAINSVRYHATGDHHARFVDIMSNFTIGTAMTVMCITDGIWIAVVMSFIACMCDHHVSTVPNEAKVGFHALLLHLPVLLGFFAIAFH